MRKKQLRFAENHNNPLFFETGKEGFDRLRGQWHNSFFKEQNPIVLELGCGTGEYAVSLAMRDAQHNFIGVDIKGARMWVGAHKSLQEGLTNIAFLRTRIELLNRFFVHGEVDAIYITFPDPHPKDRDAKKRLTSPRFLDLYQTILAPQGKIHLKTDNTPLYHYTLDVVKGLGGNLLMATEDLYATHPTSIHTTIQTVYEKRFLAEGEKIKYTCFVLPDRIQT